MIVAEEVAVKVHQTDLIDGLDIMEVQDIREELGLDEPVVINHWGNALLIRDDSYQELY